MKKTYKKNLSGAFGFNGILRNCIPNSQCIDSDGRA